MARSPFGIESHVRHGVGTVRVRGELDLDRAARLVEVVAAATPAGGRVEVDVREVGFIDSAGIAALDRCRRRAMRVDSEIVVLCVERSAVARLLHWTGLASVIDVRAGPAVPAPPGGA